MAFEIGGRADKLGNRYEGRWVARQLLALLNEEIRSVTIEAIGDDEKGVELWIEMKEGRRQAHQCKARNRSKEFWSIADLTARGLFASLRFQLERNPDWEFVFVSGVPATVLGDICDSARNSIGNSEDFYHAQIRGQGMPRQTAFRQFCEAFAIDAASAKDRATAYEYLRRTRVELYAGDDATWGNLLAKADYLLTGKPETTTATLLGYAENHDRFGKPIFSDILLNHLKTLDIYPKNLAHDDRVVPGIERLQEQFDASIRPTLIAGDLIHRDETDECLKALGDFGVVTLHGAAGVGKTGVLYELTGRLRSDNTPFLPIRLDRRVPKNSSTEFGRDMGLPDSPAHCLSALAGNRPCVLILDQLDAIRWTSAHSANALDVCKELVSQVLAARHEGKLLCVVLSCRSFDLEHDPQIRHWLSNQNEQQLKKIEVKSLPENSVRTIVGDAFADMTHRQKSILSNAQNLGMWVQLRKDLALPLFRSTTELMKHFWAFRRRQLEEAGVGSGEINQVLTTLIEWLDVRGQVSAPCRIVSDCSVKSLEAFKSYGIIQEQDGQISFCHQSYLDFQIAQRLLAEIDRGGTMVDWLGQKQKQTLMRREQLRQAVALLSEESPSRFLDSVKQILCSDRVRFHLKHLLLEVIGQVEDIPDTLAEYCMTLLTDECWKLHFLETVCWGHSPYVEMLIQRGNIDEWLSSGEESSVNLALWLLHSVAGKAPDVVSKQLVPYARKGDTWEKKVLNTLSWDVTDDSDAMFEMRLGLVSRGHLPEFVNWKNLCAKHPLRSLCLIEAVLSTFELSEDDDQLSVRRSRFENWYGEDVKVLMSAAAGNPIDAWDRFIPHIQRLTLIEASRYDPKLEKWRKNWPGKTIRDHLEIERGAVEMCIQAGRMMAQSEPDALLRRVKHLEDSSSSIVKEILIEVFAALPKQHADVGIRWLLGDQSRLRLGEGFSEPKWMPAVRLISAQSPNCSSDVFQELEQTLVGYRDPDEKRLAEHYLKGWRVGCFDHYWGRAQRFLLPALARNRIGGSTADLIGVLNRKFEGYEEWRFISGGRTSGGWIGSKLDKNLDKISDRCWLEIIRNPDIPEESRGRWEQVDEEHAVASSIDQFSRSLSTIAKRYPERFGKLSMTFPEATHHSYVSAVLEAVASTKPDSDVPKEDAPSWEPATLDTALSVWTRFSKLNDRNVCMAFCRLVSARSTENLPNSTIETLLELARAHPDLEPGKLNIHCDKTADEATVWVLFENTINCVRGVAAGAIAQLLWHHPDWLEKLRPGIEALVSDPHPAVRMASIDAILPIVNIDRKQAVSWFCQAAKDDPRVPASPHAIRFFNCTIQEFADQHAPVIREMVNSPRPDVAERGAEAATAYGLFYGLFSDELQECRGGTQAQRKGVAEIVASLIDRPELTEKCGELLAPLFNDPYEEVRKVTASMFGQKFWDLPASVSLAKLYVRSKAFEDESHWLLHSLEESKNSLLPFSEIILDVCDTIATTLLESTRDSRSRIGRVTWEISPLLLRLYEQAQERAPDIAVRCLDAWDVLFEKRVGVARDLTKAIER